MRSILFLALILFISCNSNMSSEEDCCTYANQLIKDIEYQKAIKLLNSFLVKNENNHRALVLRSGAYLNVGDTASAKKDLLKAFQIDSTNSSLINS